MSGLPGACALLAVGCKQAPIDKVSIIGRPPGPARRGLPRAGSRSRADCTRVRRARHRQCVTRGCVAATTTTMRRPRGPRPGGHRAPSPAQRARAARQLPYNCGSSPRGAVPWPRLWAASRRRTRRGSVSRSLPASRPKNRDMLLFRRPSSRPSRVSSKKQHVPIFRVARRRAG
jgi:hypothetical protein